MPIYEYDCRGCGRTTEHLHNPHQGGGGKLRIVYGPGGKRVEGVFGTPRPEILTCPHCGGDATYQVSRSRACLTSDANQSCGWSRPGMTDISYANGPDGHPATHLRERSVEISNQSAATL